MADYENARSLISRLIDVENEARQLGMWKTMHALNEAKNIAGWEEAERREALNIPEDQ